MFLNIVFDLCGVVFDWTTEAILANVSIAPMFHAQVKAGLFKHSDWLELDRGTLPRQKAIRRAAAHTGLGTATVADLIPHIPHSLVVMSEMVDLLQRLKASGQTLYYLSNMNLDCIEHIEHTFAFWDMFEGGIVSCRVQINLDPAKQFGIQTVHFESTEQCEAQLKSLGIF